MDAVGEFGGKEAKKGYTKEPTLLGRQLDGVGCYNIHNYQSIQSLVCFTRRQFVELSDSPYIEF